MTWRTLHVLLVAILLPAFTIDANDSVAAPTTRLRASGIDGSLVICGGGDLPKKIIESFLKMAGEEIHLVVIPTAGARADDANAEAEYLDRWKQRGLASLRLLHTRDRNQANQPEFVAPIKQANAVWFGGGQQSRIADAYVGTTMETELQALLKRGGVVGGTSAGAAVMSRLMIAGGNPEARLGTGFDFLPGTVIDQHFLKRNRFPRLAGVIDSHNSLVGMGIDEETALMVSGRQIRVMGNSTVTVYLAESDNRPARREEFSEGQVLDLTALRRAALARAQNETKQTAPATPSIGQGALVIAGGSTLPNEIISRFVALAGGRKANIVVIASAKNHPDSSNEAARFRRAGAIRVNVFDERDSQMAEAPQFLSSLRAATGLWFAGGRQYRLIDLFESTEAADLFHKLLKGGGVIGGSSAGASVLADYLVRGNPLTSDTVMVEGYENGFGFLPGTAIDQHFTSRQRLPDMKQLMRHRPDLLGIGIDESTAIVVQGHTAEVVGRNRVHFLNAQNFNTEQQPQIYKLRSGKRFDLQQRLPANRDGGNSN